MTIFLFYLGNFIWNLCCRLKTLSWKSKNYEKYKEELKLDGLTFPMTIHQIKKFEKQNRDISGKCNLSVLWRTMPCTIILNKNISDRKHVVTLLLIHDDDNEDSHFVLVRDMARLLASCTKVKRRQEVCMYCFQRFNSMEEKEDHETFCGKETEARLLFPVKGRQKRTGSILLILTNVHRVSRK